MINYALCWHLHRVIYGSLIELKRRLVAQQGIIQYASTRLEPEPKNKKGEEKGKVIHACGYSALQRTGCCKRQSRTAATALSPLRNILQPSWISQSKGWMFVLFPPLTVVSVLLCALLKYGLSIPCKGEPVFLTLTIPSVSPAFSWYSLSWNDILITQWVKKKDAGVAPQKYHICTATRNSVLLWQCIPSSETLIWGTFQPCASAKGTAWLPNILLWQHRQAFSLRRSSVNRKGRGTGSERVALHTCCARVVCRKYSCKSLWGMIKERTKSSVDKYWDRLACFCEEL